MTTVFIEQQDWEDKFKPIIIEEDGSWGGAFIDSTKKAPDEIIDALANHLGKADQLKAARLKYDDAYSDECQTELFGAPNFVRDHAWTIVESDGIFNIVPGWATVNRFGFILTEEPHCPGFDMIVVDTSDFPDHKMNDWREALVVINEDDDEDEGDEKVNAEDIGIAQSAICNTLLASGHFINAYISEEGGEAKLVVSMPAPWDQEPQFAGRLAENILDSRLAAGGRTFFKKFDKDLVEIKRNQISTTQGTFEIRYAGEKITDYHDNIRLMPNIKDASGHSVYQGATDAEIMKIAARLYYAGDIYNKIPPIGEKFILSPSEPATTQGFKA